MKAPKIIEELDYEKIASEIKRDFINKFSEQISLLESDVASKLIECFAYRELLLREAMNKKIRGLLIDYATGADLDHLCLTLYRVRRNLGTFPRARVSFELAAVASSDVLIPRASELAAASGETAQLVDDVIIRAGEKAAEGVMMLKERTKASNAKCELLQTPLPYVVQPKQLEPFSGGAGEEDDEAFRARAKLSIHKYSTAGAPKAYVYHALAADTRVKDVRVIDDPEGCRVSVIIKTTEQTPELLAAVDEYLKDDERRPLNALITTAYAVRKEVLIKALVKFEHSSAAAGFVLPNKELAIAQDYALSKVYKDLEQNGVASVEILNEFDLSAGDDEFLALSYEITFEGDK